MQGKIKTKVHGRLAFTLGGKEETAEAHSSTSLLGLFVGDGSMWVLTKGGPFGDGGNLVRLFLGGEPIPEPGPGIGYLEKPSLSTGGELLSSANKFIRGLVARIGEREPGDFRLIAFDRFGLLGGSADIGGAEDRRDDRCGGLDGGLMYRSFVS